jgi:hypothetical protein
VQSFERSSAIKDVAREVDVELLGNRTAKMASAASAAMTKQTAEKRERERKWKRMCVGGGWVGGGVQLQLQLQVPWSCRCVPALKLSHFYYMS